MGVPSRPTHSEEEVRYPLVSVASSYPAQVYLWGRKSHWRGTRVGECFSCLGDTSGRSRLRWQGHVNMIKNKVGDGQPSPSEGERR